MSLDQAHVYVQLEQGPRFHCMLMGTKRRKKLHNEGDILRLTWIDDPEVLYLNIIRR